MFGPQPFIHASNVSPEHSRNYQTRCKHPHHRASRKFQSAKGDVMSGAFPLQYERYSRGKDMIKVKPLKHSFTAFRKTFPYVGTIIYNYVIDHCPELCKNIKKLKTAQYTIAF
uniref:Uncharacterized protein n=1 Tax=Photinus pyralis TaxID=7054 RepID=A0A1Y1M7J8_PHOPY